MSKLSELLTKFTDRVALIHRKYNSAIIVAAGSGTRAMTDGTTKQMTPLLGIPVVARTISVFEACEFIDEIIVVAREEEIPQYDTMQCQYGWHKVTAVVPGRETRQLSVLEGFKRISERSQFVYIHDGARCLVTEQMIAAVGHAACLDGAAIAAARSADTVKVDGPGKLATVDRDTVWLAQTPQVFMTELYRAAAYRALKEEMTVTDDASLVEAAGFAVTPVDCGATNRKITHPMDFAIAETILRYRDKQEGDS